MNKSARLALLICFAILLSACHPLVLVEAVKLGDAVADIAESSVKRRGAPEQSFILDQKPDPGQLASIETIALLRIPDPPRYGKDNFEFGSFSFGDTSFVFIKKFLQEHDYDVIEYNPYRENKYGLINDYSLLNFIQADAYLDVAPVQVEYRRAALDNPLGSETTPYVSAVARLVAAGTNEVIYAESFQYGWKANFVALGVRIESPPDHKYENHETQKTNQVEAIERLVQGIELISLSLVGQISKVDF